MPNLIVRPNQLIADKSQLLRVPIENTKKISAIRNEITASKNLDDQKHEHPT